MERSWLFIAAAALLAGLLINWLTFIPCGNFLLYIVPGVVSLLAGWYAMDHSTSTRSGFLNAALAGAVAAIGLTFGIGLAAAFVPIDPGSNALTSPRAWHEQLYLQGVQPKAIDIIDYILEGLPQFAAGMANPVTRAGSVWTVCCLANLLPGLLLGLIGGLVARSSSHI